VVAFHAGLPVPGGFMGVDVFFAISGFVITTMLLSELESSGGIDFPRFCLRRARRLLPASRSCSVSSFPSGPSSALRSRNG
jgi:peptidoglycan/LPS O-acetylase OafA/YrhL